MDGDQHVREDGAVCPVSFGAQKAPAEHRSDALGLGGGGAGVLGPQTQLCRLDYLAPEALLQALILDRPKLGYP